MPLCPQITNTPVTVVQNYSVSAVSFSGSSATYTATGNDFAAGNQVVIAGLSRATFNGTFIINSIAGSNFTVTNNQTFTITGVSFTPSTATYIASGHTYTVGQSVTISDLAPAGYNGTFTISSVVAGSSFTVSNGTNATVTDQNGSVISSAVSGQSGTASLFTVSSVLPVVAATTTQVNTAQATATTALADAAIAYNTAVNSLQPSAFAIQNPTTKQLSAIDATGLTVYVNSPTTGARVVMNSLGLAGFNSGGSATFSISASTGAAVFSGSVTGSTITGGTLNIAGNAIIDASGFLTASGATVTGAINATSGYIGSPTNGWIFTSSGFLRNNNSTTILYPTTAPGGDANTYSIFTDRGVYAERIFSTGTQASSIFSLGGLSVNGQVSGAAGSFIVNSSGNMTTVGSITASGTVSTSGAMSANTLSVASTTTFNGASNSFPNITTSTAAANLRWGTTTSGRIFEVVASSARFKENIVDINTVFELQANRLLDLPVRAFTYKKEYLSEGDERAEIMVPGFITEEMDEIYPIAVDYEKGLAHNWNEKFVIPGMLALIQDLYKEVQTLKGE